MGKGRDARHRDARISLRAGLESEVTDLRSELLDTNEELRELRAHHRANLQELKTARKYSDGIDLDRLAAVLQAALDRLRRREDLLREVTEAFVEGQNALTTKDKLLDWQEETLRRYQKTNEELRLEVLNLKQVAERRRRDAEKWYEADTVINELKRDLASLKLRKLVDDEEMKNLRTELERARLSASTQPVISKKDWRLLAKLVHPDVHAAGRQDQATEAMLLLNTKIRPASE
jgi:chromosome segregation ATPase